MSPTAMQGCNTSSPFRPLPGPDNLIGVTLRCDWYAIWLKLSLRLKLTRWTARRAAATADWVRGGTPPAGSGSNWVAARLDGNGVAIAGRVAVLMCCRIWPPTRAGSTLQARSPLHWWPLLVGLAIVGSRPRSTGRCRRCVTGFVERGSTPSGRGVTPCRRFTGSILRPGRSCRRDRCWATWSAQSESRRGVGP